MSVGLGHKLFNQKPGDARVSKCVPKIQILRLVNVQSALELQPRLSEPRGVDRVRAVVFPGKREVRSPVCTSEMRILIAEIASLNQPTGQPADRDRFSPAAYISARIFDISARSPKGLFTRPELLRYTDWRYSRNSNGSTGNAAASIDHFEAEAVRQ